VGKVSACYGGSWICSGGGGGGLVSGLLCWLGLFGIGYVIYGTDGGYVICGGSGGYVIYGAGGGCG
jgi:hypothetical protein